ncbi:MAG: tetratricopeptide repeat protein [Deltaproteobacteria bacterium]|nr:tetratricopeptide repeat protein [Deltaproteobacteria bacterium]
MDAEAGLRIGIATFALLLACHPPALGQIGGLGGLQRAGDEQRTREEGTPEGRLRAIATGRVRVAALQAARVADPAAGDAAAAPGGALDLAREAWHLAELCDAAALDDPADPSFPPCMREHRALALEALAPFETMEGGAAGADEALFYLGWYRVVAGDPAGGGRALERLLAAHPDSAWVPEAVLLLGDAAFEAGDMAGALTRYDALEAHPRSPMRPYGRYKAAWCHFNLGAFVRAREVLGIAAEMTGPGSPWEDLHREVLRDYALFYSKEGEPAGALATFAALEEAAAAAMAERLAVHYRDDGRPLDAAAVLEALLARWPGGARAPAWKEQLEELRPRIE